MESYLIGLSGGADSAYAASLLKKRGHAVEGVYLKMYKEADPTPALKAAEELGIPLHVVDCEEEFEKRVLCHFVDCYKMGRTPNPCVECNRYVKIKILCDIAREKGFSRVVTGHYASVAKTEDGRYCICRAENEKKDQSYVLWGLTQEQLSMLYLPLSAEEKEELRQALEREGVSASSAKDSMDICFLPEGNYAAFVEERGGACPPGAFIDSEGRVLGKHKGILHYTVGQRKHLGIALGQPMFVSAIDPEKNTVTLVPSGGEYGHTARIKDLQFQSLAPVSEGTVEGLTVKLRYGQKPMAVRVELAEGEATLHFEEPVRAVTPGQSAVFYDGERLAFGGYLV
ncbi:MAG: tRNA 2-thiouridine(34) synthase MnmA [Clostridia bacterium]|nr:tRNA 2-thiouridine(34) synthase MnmA [Clostridia bacterium]